ncbi:hypothetical protein WJX73_006102 [Symbiochloris irregularis]|uniref:Glutathione S-transferase n=1 Tax=Symbiochloris irregularis TaxID=706552 RepID=A0AAW1P4L8_9CHLO
MAGNQAKLKLYHCPGTRSSRIVWLFKELGLDVEIEKFENLQDCRTRKGYDAISPLRRVPTLVTQHGPLIESGAIQEYVLRTRGNGRLQPAVDSPQYQKYLMWTFFAEPTLTAHAATFKQQTLLLPEADRIPQLVEIAVKQLRAALAVVEAALAEHKQDYILGADFSAADISLIHGLRNAHGQGNMKDFPLTTAYVERLQARPLYKESYVPYPTPTC